MILASCFNHPGYCISSFNDRDIRVVSTARRICYRLLRQIESRRLFSDDALNIESMQCLDIRDRHLVTEIVYGSLRWKALLDFVLAKVSSRPWHKVDPGAKILLRMSLYQMWQMDRIPDYALVNDAVDLAKRKLGRGIERYLNGILRQLTRTRPWEQDRFMQEASPYTQVSLPQWLWKRWVLRYGENAATDFARSLNRPPQISLHPTRRIENDSYLPSEAVLSDFVPGAYIQADPLARRNETESSRFYYQDEASQLIPHLLGPATGFRIWDACAAPGGKTIILKRNCGESGRIVASDMNAERISRLSHFLRNSGGGDVDIVVADAAVSPPFCNWFDAVLADVPCSGLGTLRRNPEIKWRFHPAKFRSLQQTQIRIICSVSKAVRIGGFLLYSTCSTEPEENEHVVESFLRSHPEFQLVRPLYPPDIETWTGADAMVRTFPSTRLWDGFFAALMVRYQ